MYNILSFLAKDAGTGGAVTINTSESCQGLAAVIFYGVYAVKVIQIVVPILLIIWGSIDLLKSIISGDEKKISAARKPFIQRLISAVLVFLLPWIVNAVINFATGKNNTETKKGAKNKADWVLCWQEAWNGGNGGITASPFDPFSE